MLVWNLILIKSVIKIYIFFFIVKYKSIFLTAKNEYVYTNNHDKY